MVNSNDVTFSVFWRTVIAILAVPSAGYPQMKTILHYPFNTVIKCRFGNIPGKAGSDFFNGHEMKAEQKKRTERKSKTATALSYQPTIIFCMNK